MSAYEQNNFHTTQLVLNVMNICAQRAGVDNNDNDVANKLYWICCDLESYPADADFGTSDYYTYVKAAEEAFDTFEIVE